VEDYPEFAEALIPSFWHLLISANFFQNASALSHCCRCVGMALAAMSLHACARFK
jgi:hypothetical protein